MPEGKGKGPVKSRKRRVKKAKKGKKKEGARQAQYNLLRGIKPKAHLSSCTDNFLLAAVDPFKYTRKELPCIPDDFTAATQRIRCRAIGTGYIGTAGFGFVSVYEPCGVASDAAFGTVSAANYAGTSVVTSATGVSPFYSDSPIVDASYSASQKQWRVVGCGLRIMYSGTELNMSGIVGPLTTYNHQTLQAQSLTNSSQFRNYEPRSFANRKWHKVVRTPFGGASTSDITFQTAAPSTFTNLILALMVSGVAGESFQYEVIAYGEVAGAALSNPIPSEADSIGLAATTSALAKTVLTRAGDWTYNTVKNVALDYVKSNVTPYLGLPGVSRNDMRILEIMGEP